MLTTISDYTPAVFAVNNEYQIMLPVKKPCTFWIKIGSRCFYDDSNGIMRSNTDIHRVSIPIDLLDSEKKYSVCYQVVEERKPYFSTMGEIEEIEFIFHPVKQENIRIYHISDAHGMADSVIKAAKTFIKYKGGIDLLILNGDILDHSGSKSNFMIIYNIITNITHGEIPVVFSRGNHDLRGFCAENISEYTPTRFGYSYYSFRVGNLWGLSLDCGEDKTDDNEEYSGTICCHDFRLKETEYIKSIIKNADKEYNQKGVEHRIIISHIPFTYINEEPFDIEKELYKEWVILINEHIKPEYMLSGHLHIVDIDKPDSERDSFGMNFPVIVGSKIDFETKYFIGCGLICSKEGTTVIFNDHNKIISEEQLKKNN